jgi:hypothetical protein
MPESAPLRALTRGPEPAADALGPSAWRRLPQPTPRAGGNRTGVICLSIGGSAML